MTPHTHQMSLPQFLQPININMSISMSDVIRDPELRTRQRVNSNAGMGTVQYTRCNKKQGSYHRLQSHIQRTYGPYRPETGNYSKRL